MLINHRMTTIKKILVSVSVLAFLLIVFFPGIQVAKAACSPAECQVDQDCTPSGSDYKCVSKCCVPKTGGGGGGNNQLLDFDKIQMGAFPTAFLGTNTKIGEIISMILPYVFLITGILLLIYLLLGGFQLMFAAGDPKKVEGARGKITSAVIGFVIIFIAYWLTQLIGRVFNITIIRSIFP